MQKAYGCKKDSDDMGGTIWAIYTPDTPMWVIERDFEIDGYYGGPGQRYAHRAWIRNTKTRILVTQVVGIDC